MVRPADHGDQFPGDVSNTTPPSPTDNFAEMDYNPAKANTYEKKLEAEYTFEEEVSLPYQPGPSERDSYQGIIMRRIEPGSNPETYTVLLEDGKIVTGIVLSQLKSEVFRPGEPVVVTRGMNKDVWYIQGNKSRKELKTLHVRMTDDVLVNTKYMAGWQVMLMTGKHIKPDGSEEDAFGIDEPWIEIKENGFYDISWCLQLEYSDSVFLGPQATVAPNATIFNQPTAQTTGWLRLQCGNDTSNQGSLRIGTYVPHVSSDPLILALKFPCRLHPYNTYARDSYLRVEASQTHTNPITGWPERHALLNFSPPGVTGNIIIPGVGTIQVDGGLIVYAPGLSPRAITPTVSYAETVRNVDV